MPIPHSNRSPSPIPHSRNPDSNPSTPTRRPSVVTNPRSLNPASTPANSPSGFGRRLSAGNEGIDEKENEQSTKSVKPRSSASGSKNFMSPTISAACKLSPSPRKKVLEERNESLRSSTAEGVVPKSDQKIFEPQMESMGTDSEPKKVILERPFDSKPVKKVTFAGSTLDSGNLSESVVLKSDCVVKNERSSDSVSRIIAPLDADPSFLPYDPKTNYLSPRPRFLYYKPKLRLNGKDDDEGVRCLEDTFASSESNSSDTCDSVEEILDSDDSQRDSENSSFVEEEKNEEVDDDIHGSESLVYERKDVHENSSKVVEGKVKDKRVLPKRLLLICSMIAVLLVSCYSFSATYSPDTGTTILKALNISQLNQPAAVVDLAKANLNLFSQRFKKFSIESMSHLVNIGQGGGQLSPPLRFMNLTELQNDYLVCEKSSDRVDTEVENSHWADDDDVEEVKGVDIVETFKEETFGEHVSDSFNEPEPEIENDLLPIEASPPQEEAASDLDIESHEYVHPEHSADITPEDHKHDSHQCDVIANPESDATVEPLSEDYVAITPVLDVGIENESQDLEANVSLESDVNVEPLQDYAQTEEYAASTEAPVFEVDINTNLETLKGNVNLESDATVERLPEDINVGTPSDAIHPTNARTKTLAYLPIGMTALVLALGAISFAAFINRKRGNGSEQNLDVVDTTANDESLAKKTILTTSSVMEQLHQENIPSHNWTTIDDDVGESFSSAMSSYQSHNKNNRSRSAADDEAHSGGGERRPRKYSKRESLSSSDFSHGGDAGSHSYGSFTTHERIPIKKAIGDVEVVTPVRRSSRLRSHVTS